MILRALFGGGTWGAGGNLVAWVLCGMPTVVVSAWRHRVAMHRRFDRIERHLGMRPPGEQDPGPDSP